MSAQIVKIASGGIVIDHKQIVAIGTCFGSFPNLLIHNPGKITGVGVEVYKMTGVSRAANSVFILGSDVPCGVYALRMAAAHDLDLRFGRYRGGAPVLVPAGDLLYVGSAMAQKGSMTLAHRLLRHATRSRSLNPHTIRRELCEHLVQSGLGPNELRPPQQKRCFWNIDYLLDEESVQLLQVYALRTPRRLEDEAASLIASDAVSHVVAPGLGAHDRPGSTHLLHITAGDTWWDKLPTRLARLGD